MTDFDEVIDRRGTACLKWDFAEQRGRPADALPLWVADMDHATAAPIIEALHERVETGIFGYTDRDEAYDRALVGWFERRYGWHVEAKWNVVAPGVVPALAVAVQAYTEPGDPVLIEEPVYYPFRGVIEANGRKVVSVPLVRKADGTYGRDLAAVEQAVREHDVGLMLLCNPHNPVGHLWSRQELAELADLAIAREMKVVSDEIHADLTYPGHAATPFASLSPQAADLTIACTSPSKAFNLAGLQLANILIPNALLRSEFRKALLRFGYSQPSALGAVACRAAYESGDAWLDALREHMAANRTYVVERLAGIEGIDAVDQQATYLMWLDCCGLIERLGIDAGDLDVFFTQQAKLWLDDGLMFGEPGRGYTRLNIACPRATLKAAFDRLDAAVAGVPTVSATTQTGPVTQGE
ncbi:MAG: MalY/PatB family protein [Actinomycetaceae bacterium]|nr:MalY/PatB family protein [Actinomycetaceae bacterium]